MYRGQLLLLLLALGSLANPWPPDEALSDARRDQASRIDKLIDSLVVSMWLCYGVVSEDKTSRIMSHHDVS